MLYKKIYMYVYVNVRIVTISLLCLTTGVVHQIFTQFREIDRLSHSLSLSFSLLIYPFFSPYINLFLPYITSFFARVRVESPLSSPPRVCRLYMTKGGLNVQ